MALRVIVAVLLLGSASFAHESGIAIAPLTTGQSAPAELQRAFADELPRALGDAGFALMPPNEVDMKVGERPEFLQCKSGGCLAEEAAFLHVARLALPRLERAPDGGVVVGVGIYDVALKRMVGDAVDRAGSANELRDKLHVMAVKLREQLPHPGRLEVRAQPIAAVSVDGQPRGNTPWSGELDAGDHLVTLEAGGARVERDVHLAPGTTARVEVQLTAPPAPRHSLLKPLAWTTLAVGALAVGAGAALVALDGRGSCSLATGQRQCPDLYDTGTGGIVALAGGGALVATSVILFVVDRPRHE